MGQPIVLNEETVRWMAQKLEDAIFQGYKVNPVKIDYTTPNGELIKSLRRDVWQFSGAKNYQQMKEMTESLIHPDGRFRTFSEFRSSVAHITSDHINWLRTEYDTAIASSQMSARWAEIQRDKDLFPFLEFDATMDNRTTKLCRSLNKVVRTVDDPFWDLYYPPNHFNCRSDVHQLRDGNVTPDDEIEYPDIPPIFRTNLAKKGLIFPMNSPYYTGLPDDIRREADALFNNQFKSEQDGNG